jgi:SAM-dependent methyltransferase
MTPRERWLATLWPLVRARLPPAPARVVEVGCGALGGFVPMLRGDGYDAVGIDPQAPDGAHYQRIEFERAALPQDVDAFVASTSLHHVADPAEVIDRISSALTSGGAVVVVEWAWETFDRPTAEWCFERLRRDGAPGWLHRRRDEWLDSGQEWASYLRGWAEREGLHPGEALVGLLDERLERRLLTRGPYFFPELADTSEADEQAAIDADRIRPARIDYVGTRRLA